MSLIEKQSRRQSRVNSLTSIQSGRRSQEKRSASDNYRRRSVWRTVVRALKVGASVALCSLALGFPSGYASSELYLVSQSLGVDLHPSVILRQERLSAAFRSQFKSTRDLRTGAIENYFLSHPFELMAFRSYMQQLHEMGYVQHQQAINLVSAAFVAASKFNPDIIQLPEPAVSKPPVAVLPEGVLSKSSDPSNTGSDGESSILDFGESEQRALDKQAEADRAKAIRELEERERQAKNVALAAALIEEFSKAPNRGEAVQEKVARAIASATENQAQTVSDQFLDNAEISITNTNDDTEVSVRGLIAYDNGGVNNTFAFNEFGYSSADQNETLNVGFGVRKLDSTGKLMVGANVVYDRELNRNHQRGSVGIELVTSPFQLTANRYYALSGDRSLDGTLVERPMSGHDVDAKIALPYFPGLFAGYNQSMWYSDTSANITRDRYTLGGNLSQHLSLELSHNDYNRAVDDDQKATLSYNYMFGAETSRPTLFTPSFHAFEFAPIGQHQRYKMIDRENNIITEVADSAALTVTFRAL